MKKVTIKLTSELLSDLFKGKEICYREGSAMGKPEEPAIALDVRIIPPNHGYFISVEDMAKLESLSFGLPLCEMSGMIRQIREANEAKLITPSPKNL